MGDSSDATRSELSYNVLKDVLQSSMLNDDDEAVITTRMRVDPRHVKEFERILRMILKTTHTVGHVSTCVVKPPPGEYTYTSIVKYSSLCAMRKIYPPSMESGVDFYKLLSARDSLLLEPPTYQIEGGFGTWIESDGNTRPMWDDSEDTNLVYNTIPKPCCDDSCDNPHGLNVRASFVAPTKHFQLFQPRYQRNNKKGGQKNLRCFPCCRNGRHVSSGFCGDSIRVHVAVSRITESGGIKICPIATRQPAVLAFARFLNLEGAFDPAVSGPDVFPGHTIEKSELYAFVRDKEHPLSPLFPGILRGAAMESRMQSAIFEFNAECKAWHYGWTAPRGQGLSGSDAQHVLEILFMKPLGSFMFCLERLRSDTFSIFSSRRASHSNVKPEPEAFEADDDDADRGQKRKRALPNGSRQAAAAAANATAAPPAASPAPYTMPSSSSAVDTRASTHAASSSSFVDASSNTGTAMTTTPPPPSTTTNSDPIKVEQAPWSTAAAPSSSEAPSSHEALQKVMYIHNPRPTTLEHAAAAPAAELAQQQHQQQQNTLYGLTADMDLFADSGPSDLMNHTLFADTEQRRVVSSAELPWSELYSLFDTLPVGDASDDNGGDDDGSPGSSPLSSSTVDTSECATSTAADALLKYL